MRQEGQSLIETIVAIFILTTGLTSGLTLAVFIFGSASDITEKITATGIAREGVEAVRRMRDSNWLADTLTSCPDVGSNQSCYPNWLTKTYDITGSPGSGVAYRLNFDPASLTAKWTLTSSPGYQLYRAVSGGYNHDSSGTPTNFYRKLTIIYENTAAPYSGNSPLVLVRSAVWWHGRNCAAVTDLVNPSDTNCKLITEEYLTNWKNY